MKDQPPKSIKASQLPSFSENNRESTPFFSKNTGGYEQAVHQQKANPFFARTSSGMQVNTPYSHPDLGLVQREVNTDTSSQSGQQPVLENTSTLPDSLKSGMELLSGYSLDEVKVHYHSTKPAALDAHAYAQGNDIHIATGQEKHLPHEAWHVVQQKQGRVTPTVQLTGNIPINNDSALEKEADLMGEKALKISPGYKQTSDANLDSKAVLANPPIQGVWVKGSNFQAKGKRANAIGISSLESTETEELLDALAEIGTAATFTTGGTVSMLKHADGREWVFTEQFYGEDFFNLGTIRKLVEKRWTDLHADPRKFDGRSRAEDDSEQGKMREDWGANYQDPIYAVDSPSKVGRKEFDIAAQSNAVPDSKMTIEAQPGFVRSSIIHFGAWDKGSRTPGQSTTMGSVNAKNYISYYKNQNTLGRYEWLHLVGSSLGGPNVVGNLVAGTFDANTMEIPQENRMALWKEKAFPQGKNITFIAEATLDGDTWIADDRLRLTGKDSEGNAITKDYDPMRQLVLTQSEYDQIKKEIEKLAKERADGKVQASEMLVNMGIALIIGVPVVLGAVYFQAELMEMFGIF